MAKGVSYSIFDILGPVMIGPSSSHTAGACRLALTARKIVDFPVKEVIFQLHGSFAHTYTGHGTDRALAGGILGYEPDDERLIYAIDKAREQGINLTYEPIDLGNVHPNSIRFCFMSSHNQKFYVTGASIGGGAIRITNIDGTETNFTGNFPTLILRYPDYSGMISNASSILTAHQINIATMQVNRVENIATMIIELDDPFNKEVVKAFQKLPKIEFFKAIDC